MTEILSQDEIDALLTAISTGEVDTTDYSAAKEQRKVKIYGELPNGRKVEYLIEGQRGARGSENETIHGNRHRTGEIKFA